MHGMRLYVRDFLMKFKDMPVCKEVPPNLINSTVFSVDVVVHPPMPMGMREDHYRSRVPDKRV